MVMVNVVTIAAILDLLAQADRLGQRAMASWRCVLHSSDINTLNTLSYLRGKNGSPRHMNTEQCFSTYHMYTIRQRANL